MQQPEGQVNNKNHQLDARNVVLFINLGILMFYSIAVYYSFQAYREFKGTAEDHIGYEALKNDEQQNIIAYGIINKPA